MPQPSREPQAPSLHQRWFWLAALALCVMAYLRGLVGSFLFDDFSNIVDNPALRALDGSTFRWLALALSSNAGPLRRPISMLSFGVDYSLFGLSPLAFKTVNLALHLISGTLLYALGRRLAGRLHGPNGSSDTRLTNALALLAAALWLLHPLNLSDVVYVVQRMNELAALFTLAGLLCYTEGRLRMLRGEPGLLIAVAGLGVFGLLAVLSKENGALITTYALVIEAICFRFEAPQVRQRQAVKALFWLTVALPIALFIAYVGTHPAWLLKGYAGRDFTLTERLLSEPRILCHYLLWIVLPLPSWMGIFHDDMATSTGLLSPLSTLPAILFLLAMVASAWKLRQRSPGFAFAVAWYLAGHAMESTIYSLELVFEHRNYLPMAGLLLGSVCGLAPWVRTHLAHRWIVTASTALVLALATLTAVRATEWSSQLRLALAEATHHPRSARAQYEAGRAIIFAGTAKNERKKAENEAIPYFERGMALDPTDVYPAASLLLIYGGRDQITDSAVNDLAYRVGHIKQGQINPFLVVQTAAIERNIRLRPEQMKLLTESALDNPHFTPSMHAMVLSNYGHYLYQVVHDDQSAIRLTMAAAAMDPKNPLFQLNLTRLALALAQPEQAASHLAIAEQLNKAGIYDQAIENLKLQMQQVSH